MAIRGSFGAGAGSGRGRAISRGADRKDGFVWIVATAGNLINRGGHKIFPEQMEEVLKPQPAVREAAVVGVPAGRLGEVPDALVVERASVADGLLTAWCCEQLTTYWSVGFHRTPEPPETGPGKLHRSALAGLPPR